jgi:voltage-gated potassium channel
VGNILTGFSLNQIVIVIIKSEVMKQRIHQLVEKGAHGSKINLAFDYFIVSLIILNVIAIALETLNGLPEEIKSILRVFEFISIIIFTLEYLLRIYVSEITFPANSKIASAFRFIISPYGIIDLLAILPFYMPFVIKTDLRFLRIIRLIRFFRVFKISRYNSTLKLIGDVFKEKRNALGMTFFIAGLLLLISGFIMYSVENPVQPDKFPNVFASFWWAVATLTTVGYGDIYPITVLGKVISSIVAFLGIGLIALPTGIISSGFIEKIGHAKDQKGTFCCPHCGKEIAT